MCRSSCRGIPNRSSERIIIILMCDTFEVKKVFSSPFYDIFDVGSHNALQAAVDTVVATLQCSVPMARVELLDEVSIYADIKSYKRND